MSEEAEDYWERRFREADERAALLNEATVSELVEIYHISGPDFDLGSLCFQALGRRPRGEVLAAALVERRARTVRRREFAASLISAATKTASEREASLPLLMEMLNDRSVRVIRAALESMHLFQVSASGRDHSIRLRTNPRDVPVEGWPPMPSALDLDGLAVFARHRSAEVRESLGRTVWLCGDPRAVALLLRLTYDTEEFVRAQAATTLGAVRLAGGPMEGVVERLWEIVEGDSTSARFDALASLVDLGDDAAKSRVGPELRDAMNAGLRPLSRYQLVYLLYKQPSLVSESIRDRLATEWCINFGARVPSELMPDE